MCDSRPAPILGPVTASASPRPYGASPRRRPVNRPGRTVRCAKEIKSVSDDAMHTFLLRLQHVMSLAVDVPLGVASRLVAAP